MLEKKVVVISENSYMHLKNVDLLERLLNNGYSIERMDVLRTNRAEEKAIYILSRECEHLEDTGDTQKGEAPFLEGDGYANGNLAYDTWYCPKCGATYEMDYDDYDFCPKCGQKINWEGIEK